MNAGNEKIVLLNKKGEKLSCVFHLPDRPANKNHCVILCHGMLSSKDGTKQIALSRAFEEKNIACLRFDFSGCGDSEGKIEDTTISGRLQDLSSVGEEIKRRGYRIVGLVGSSLGAAVSLLAAGNEFIRGISSLVVMAAVSRPERIAQIFSREEIRRWERSGFIEMDGTRIKWEFVTDAAKHDVIFAARNIKCPTLLIHGSLDEIVPVASSKEIYTALDSKRDLVILDNADHAFTDSEHLKRVIDLTVKWTKKWI